MDTGELNARVDTGVCVSRNAGVDYVDEKIDGIIREGAVGVL